MNTTSLDKHSPMLGKYLKAHEDNPKGRAFVPLAEAYRRLGDNKKAMSLLVEGIKNHPSYHTAYVSLAQCYFDVKSYDLAYSTLRPFVHLHKDNLKVQRLYGDICKELNFLEEALDAYKLVLFLNPRDKECARIVDELEVGSKFITDSSVLDTKKEVLKRDDVETLEEDSLSESTVDDWIRLDIIEEKKAEIKNDQWQVESPLNEKVARTPDESPAILVEIFDENAKDEANSHQDAGPPFITHTLIDLYEGQGHLEKAIEVLEKIVQLKPDDEKSIARLASLKSKRHEEMPADSKLEPEEGNSTLMKLFDEKIGAKVESQVSGEQIKSKMEKFGQLMLEEVAARSKSNLQSFFKI